LPFVADKPKLGVRKPDKKEVRLRMDALPLDEYVPRRLLIRRPQLLNGCFWGLVWVQNSDALALV
jgi:hypothetical protein